MSIILFEYFVHVFRVEFEIAADPVHPSLVHPIETVPDDLSYFEIVERNVLIEVHFNDVRDKQKRELHLLGLGVLLQSRGDILGIIDVFVQAGIRDFPLHFLQRRP